MEILRIVCFFSFIICLFLLKIWVNQVLAESLLAVPACKLGGLRYFDITAFVHRTVFVFFSFLSIFEFFIACLCAEHTSDFGKQ